MNILINIVAFKIGWAASIFGAASGMPLLGPVVVLAVIAAHLQMASNPSRELLLIVMTGVIGASWDSVMVAAGWLTYPSGTLVDWLAPYWILAMWMLFATTLNMAFRWLRGRPFVAALLGAIFGPLSYYVGASLGAVEINEFAAAMTGLAAAWAVLLPGLLALATRFDGVNAAVEGARI